MIFQIKTKATMEQVYNIEAETEAEAVKIAKENTNEIIEQTQVSDAEILSITQF